MIWVDILMMVKLTFCFFFQNATNKLLDRTHGPWAFDQQEQDREMNLCEYGLTNTLDLS